MEVEILHTERCTLRPATVEDADWLFGLFNDPDVVTYIEGINWFNTDVASVRSFIESMQVNATKDLGAMWCVEYKSNNIGFILVYDLMKDPFMTYAILPEYRFKSYMSECVSAIYNLIYRHLSLKPSISTNEINIAGSKLKQKIDNSIQETYIFS